MSDYLPPTEERSAPNPWDSPPFPKQGNRSDRVLYEAIGRALITWEEIETSLAHLYAGLCGKDCHDKEANNAYGEEANFSKRLGALKLAGDAYFVKRPNQNLEAEFCWVIRTVTGFSHRRNDVAHGVARFIHMVRDPRATFLGSPEPLEWCLVPPHFREAKFVAPDMPAHILTSREINGFTRAFWPIVRRISALSQKIELPRHASRRRRALPPIEGP